MVWPFRKKPNYERDIGALTNKVRTARIALLRRKSAQYRLANLFTVNSVLALLVYVAYLVCTHRLRSPKHVTAILCSPPIIYGVRRLLKMSIGALVNSKQASLDRLVARRDTLIKDYKKKTNFDEIKKVIDDAETVDKSVEKGGVLSGSLLHNRTKRPAGPRPLPNADSNAPTLTQAGQPPKVVSGGAFPARPVTVPGVGPFPQLDMSPPAQHTWIDRILDVVLGENEASPTNRYALICAQCHAHNGLAPYGEKPENIVYRCPFCGFENGVRPGSMGPKHEGQSTENDISPQSGVGDNGSSKQEQNSKANKVLTSSLDLDQPDLVERSGAEKGVNS